MKMNQGIKERWCTALESGEYAQAKGALQTQDGYCCLGVLAHLHMLETGNAIDLTQHQVLPPTIREWAGLKQSNGAASVTIYGIECMLTGHNDSGETFKQIAAAIREQL